MRPCSARKKLPPGGGDPNRVGVRRRRPCAGLGRVGVLGRPRGSALAASRARALSACVVARGGEAGELDRADRTTGARLVDVRRQRHRQRVPQRAVVGEGGLDLGAVEPAVSSSASWSRNSSALDRARVVDMLRQGHRGLEPGLAAVLDHWCTRRNGRRRRCCLRTERRAITSKATTSTPGTAGAQHGR